MEEYKDQVPNDEHEKIKEEIQKLRQMLASRDDHSPESIREAFGEVQKAALKLFEVAYKSEVIISNSSFFLTFNVCTFIISTLL